MHALDCWTVLMLSDVQGCWRALGASFGKSITFKTTLKGNNMLMKNGLGDLWMPCLCFLGLLASLGFGLHKVSFLFFYIIRRQSI